MKYIKNFIIVSLLLMLNSICHTAPPHIGYIYPAGGQQGTTFEISIGGQYLINVEDLYITGDDINTELVKYTEPLKRTHNKLKKEMNKLSGKKKKKSKKKNNTKTNQSTGPNLDKKAAKKMMMEMLSEEDREKIKILKNKIRSLNLQLRNPMKQPNAQIDEMVTFKFTINKNAKPGEREIRVVSPLGTSNPMVFHVGSLPEEKEAKQTIETLTKKEKRKKKKGYVQKKQWQPKITKLSSLPVVANGQVLPGEVDWFKFNARKGEQMVFAVQAQKLIPYLADAVPGWFQAVLTLYNSKGKEVAYNDDFRIDPDPVLFYNVPKDGEYTLEIRDSIFRGREDFVYRIAMGELPFVTSIFPLGGKADKKTRVRISGKNLPSKTVKLRSGSKEPYATLMPVKKNGLNSNPVRFGVDSLPEKLESEPNNRSADAQALKLPIIINGRIQKRGDIDIFSFKGKAGQEIVAEIYARRLNSPLDSFLKLTHSKGKTLIMNDDHRDEGAGLTTHHADSYISFKLPSDGKYYIHTGDMQNKGSHSHAYRLRISEKQPDFNLRITPSGINILQKGSAIITAHVLRRDGFDGKIKLSIKGMEDELFLSGAVIPEKTDKIKLTISASDEIDMGYHTIEIEGTAVIKGKTVRHKAVPAEDMMQAFLYRHLVPAKELAVMVTKKSWISIAADLPEGKALKIPTGGEVDLVMKNMRKRMNNNIQLLLKDPPKGITIKKTKNNPYANNTIITLIADEKEIKAGLKGNLVVAAQVKGKKKGKKNNKRKKGKPGSLFITPAIPFEIIK